MDFRRFIPDQAQLWAIIGAITGILAVIVSIYTFAADRELRQKKLAIEVLSKSALLARNPLKTGTDIKVIVNGKQVNNFNFVSIRIINSGRQSILEADFSGPIRLLLKNADAILFATPSDRSPKSLDPIISHDENSVSIKPLLLNPEDSFNIDIGANLQESEPLQVSGVARIAGIKDIEVTEPPIQPTRSAWISFVIPLIGLILGLVSTSFVSWIGVRKASARPTLEFDPEFIEEVQKFARERGDMRARSAGDT